MIYGVILAGGMGKRLWPESDRTTPKPFLTRCGKKTLLEETIERLVPAIPFERLFISIGKEYEEDARRVVPEGVRIITEPAGRNTAPAIGLAALEIEKMDPDAVMAVFPSDHYISDPKSLQILIEAGNQLTEENPNQLVTIGIQPKYPATGYGYIKAVRPYLSPESIQLTAAVGPLRADSFHEKPDGVTAKHYLDQGGYYWNGGIFIWKVCRILDLLDQHFPEISPILKRVRHHREDETAFLESRFPELPSLSIDKAVLEKVSEIILLPAPFKWSDLGTFEAFTESGSVPADNAKNRAVGALLKTAEAEGNIVRINAGTQARPITVALGGVDHLLVVQNGETLMIVPQDREDLIQRLSGE